MMLKRMFDLTIASAMLLALSPVMIAVAVVVACTMGRPVLFRQVRPGLHGRLFEIMKFRTMTNARDADGNLLPDQERLTRVGLFLNASSLDELPGLFNVLKGDMSLVGPRPLLVEFLEHYTPEQARRHEVKPGITGLAQVLERGFMPLSKKLQLDVYYVDHHSLWMDIKLLLGTLPKVVGRSGTYPYPPASEVDDLGLSAEGRERMTGRG